MKERATTYEDISPRRVRRIRLALLSAPFILLLALEGVMALRFRAQHPDASLSIQGQYRFTYAPYRGYGNNAMYLRMTEDLTYRYNNCGFRDDEDLGPKGPNEFRVFFMGGSAAYGSPARRALPYLAISGQKAYPSSQTIAGQLQEHLQERMPHRNVKVINAAVVNYKIAQNYVMYLGFLRFLAPDLIVTMDGYNESTVFNPMNRLGQTVRMGGGELVQAVRRNSYLAYYLGFVVNDIKDWLGRTSLDEAELAAMDIEQVRREFREELAASKPNDQILDAIMFIYEQFWQAAKLDDVPILFTAQPVPTLDQKKLSPEEEVLLKYQRRHGRHKVLVAHLADRLTARAAKDPDFHALSLLRVFEDFSGMAYIDYAHLSPKANRHLAKKLADYILAQPDWINHDVRPDNLVRGAHHKAVLPSCGGANRQWVQGGAE